MFTYTTTNDTDNTLSVCFYAVEGGVRMELAYDDLTGLSKLYPDSRMALRFARDNTNLKHLEVLQAVLGKVDIHVQDEPVNIEKRGV